MRIASYNVEWFTSLFDGNNALVPDAAPSGRYGIDRQAQIEALGTVFSALDADAVLVVEAPDSSSGRSTVTSLEGFAKSFALRATEVCMGFSNDTKQEIALLYDPQKLVVRHAPRAGDHRVPRFDGWFDIDLDIDARMDRVQFSKPPLEADIETEKGTRFHLIGAHLKSKAPHGAKNDADVMRIAIANRRKQLAQAIWLRARIDQHLEEGTPLIVLGDLNDGPGLDEFEGLFGRSSVEIILGEEGVTRMHDPHAEKALSARFGATPTTARFWLGPEKRYLQALLDYIMISQPLLAYAPSWRIWHPFDDPECWSDVTLRSALLNASDHFPVTLDLNI